MIWGYPHFTQPLVGAQFCEVSNQALSEIVWVFNLSIFLGPCQNVLTGISTVSILSNPFKIYDNELTDIAPGTNPCNEENPDPGYRMDKGLKLHEKTIMKKEGFPK